MTCKDCPYYYQTEADDFPYCQFRQIAPYDPAPCEYETGGDEDIDSYGY